MDSSLELSIVVPVYNEKESVAPLLEEIVAAVGDDSENVEIVFVNDGSSDGTGEELDRLTREYSSLRTIHFERNAGQSAAMACGFRRARGRYIVALDGDGQNDPADIPRIVERLSDYPVVCGIRRKRQDSLAKRWGSKLANNVRRWVTGDTIVDTGCSLKGFHAEPLKNLYYFNGVHRFLPILLEMQGCRIDQIEVNHRPRTRGKSKYSNLGRLAKTWQDLLGVHWMQSRKLDYRVERDSGEAEPD